MKKQVLAGVICTALFVGCCAILYFTKESKQESEVAEELEQKENTSVKTSNVAPKKVVKKEDVIKKADLYANTIGLPLSMITELNTLPSNVKNAIDKVINDDSLSLLAMKNLHDKVLLIIENPNDNRHGIEFIEISKSDASKKVVPLSGQSDSSEQDVWRYDEKSQLPIEHTKLDNDNQTEYTEVWNYVVEEPIKYELKDGDGKVLSIKKETLDNANNMRQEHIIYDKHGNTKISVSTSYEGPNLTRFTYYNADRPNEGITIFSEYNDGVKVKENVYSSDFKLKNTYEAAYKDGQRESIRIFDKDNNEIEVMESK